MMLSDDCIYRTLHNAAPPELSSATDHDDYLYRLPLSSDRVIERQLPSQPTSQSVSARTWSPANPKVVQLESAAVDLIKRQKVTTSTTTTTTTTT